MISVKWAELGSRNVLVFTEMNKTQSSTTIISLRGYLYKYKQAQCRNLYVSGVRDFVWIVGKAIFFNLLMHD